MKDCTKKKAGQRENTTVVTADLVELEFSHDVESTVSSGSIELSDDVFNTPKGKSS